MVQHLYNRGDFSNPKYEVIDVLSEGGFGMLNVKFEH